MNVVSETELENAKLCLMETYDLVMLYGSDDKKDPNIYLNLMEQLCEIKHNAVQDASILEKCKGKDTVEEIERAFQEESEKANKKFHPKKTSEYKAFHSYLTEMSKSPASTQTAEGSTRIAAMADELVVESEINVFDPLTKLRMQEPVRNKLCGHHYEKSTILESLKVNKKLRCPVAGCGHKDYIRVQNLMDDNVFKMRLKQVPDTQ